MSVNREFTRQKSEDGAAMGWLRRLPPRLILWLLILPIVLYILLTAIRE